jgi:transcription elongation factor GreA
MSTNYMTRKSFERLSAQALRIKEVEIPRVSREKLEAAKHGDLSENADYEAAKDKLDLLHARLAQLGEQMLGVQFIEDLPIPGTIVSLGTRVKLRDRENDAEVEYSILGPADADLERRIISYQSPLGRGMIGKKVGDEAIIETPGGTRSFSILSIEKHQV